MDINQKNLEDAEIQKQIKELENKAKDHLSKEAMLRLGNIKSVDSEKALQIVAILN